jgi:hypothetical protein
MSLCENESIIYFTHYCLMMMTQSCWRNRGLVIKSFFLSLEVLMFLLLFLDIYLLIIKLNACICLHLLVYMISVHD